MNIQETQLMAADDFPTPQTDDRHYRRLGWIVLVLFIGIFGIWGSLAPLSSAVSAPGKVIVASNNRIVQHLEGGIIKAINVKDGDSVSYHQPLIELDSTQITAQLEIAKGKFYQSLAVESRLIAERDALAVIHFSPELSDNDTHFNLTAIKEGQHREFTARRQELNDQKMVLQQRIEQLQSKIQGLEAIISAKSSLSASYNEEIKEWEILYQQQLIDKMKLRDIKREKMRIDGDIANARADIAQAKGQIAEMNAEIIAQKQTFYTKVVTELSDTQSELSDLRSRISALQDTLEKTSIVAPSAGIVANLKIHTLGGVIPPGQPILEIVPKGEPLIIEGKVSANEVNNIHIGLETEIRFPNFAHIKSLNIIKGKVIFVAPDAILDEKAQALFYPVKIQVTSDGESELIKNHLTLQAGMPADAMIVVGSRTLADYLIKPLRNMFVKGFNEQ
ncbi:MAG: HlyD family type I secretion periplasmic adaptor subunit [Sulfuricurvum sp.]|nr:HlyD family type I secretion periplasmic adaptor subunit [Sulfuricurvum sp.]